MNSFLSNSNGPDKAPTCPPLLLLFLLLIPPLFIFLPLALVVVIIVLIFIPVLVRIKRPWMEPALQRHPSAHPSVAPVLNFFNSTLSNSSVAIRSPG